MLPNFLSREPVILIPRRYVHQASRADEIQDALLVWAVNALVLAEDVKRRKDDSALLVCRSWTFDFHDGIGVERQCIS